MLSSRTIFDDLKTSRPRPRSRTSKCFLMTSLRPRTSSRSLSLLNTKKYKTQWKIQNAVNGPCYSPELICSIPGKSKIRWKQLTSTLYSLFLAVKKNSFIHSKFDIRFLCVFPTTAKQYFSTNQNVKMTNFVQSKYDKRFSIFLHKLHSILDDFCSILRHNSNSLSFQCSQPLLVFLHYSLDS